MTTEQADRAITAARIELILGQPFFGTLALYLRPRSAAWCATAATDGGALL